MRWLETNKQDLNFGLSGLLTAPIGYLVLLFLPVYLELIANSRGLSELQIGRLASTDSVGIVIATLLFSIAIKRIRFHTMVIVGVVLTVLANTLSIFVSDFSWLCAVRVIAGLGEGLLVAVGIASIGMTSNPNRWFGIYTAMVVLVQALGLVMLPAANKIGGEAGIFAAMAIIYLLPLSVLKRLPENSQSYVADGEQSQPIAGKWFLLALSGLLCFYVGIGGTWSFISFVGTDGGLALDYVAQALSLSMIAGLLGALVFAWLGQRGSKSSLLFVSLVTMIACLYTLQISLSEWSYLTILSVFSFFWSIVGARTFAIISDADHSGRYISSAQTLVGVGYIIGPLLASQIVSDYGYLGLNNMGLVVFLACFALMLPLAQRSAPHE